MLSRISSDASGPSISDRTITTFSETIHRGRFIVTVDRNDRTVTIKNPLNRLVLRHCKHLSWISIKLSCLDTIPLVSLDSIIFLSHFRIHGGVEIKIWWRIEGEITAWIHRSRSSCSSWLRGLMATIWSQSGISGSGFCFLICHLDLISV